VSPAPATPIKYTFDTAGGAWTLYDASGNPLVVNTADKRIRIGETDSYVGFYGTAPIVLQTGVAVTAGGIHAALVALGLITA